MKTMENMVLMDAVTMPYTTLPSLFTPAFESLCRNEARIPSTMTEQMSCQMRRHTKATFDPAPMAAVGGRMYEIVTVYRWVLLAVSCFDLVV